MTYKTAKSDALLLLTAAIWGFAFVAQRTGMEHIGPFLYTGIRFLLGALTLVPVLIFEAKKETASYPERLSRRTFVLGGLLAGCVLFLGVSLQQIGLVYTSAGKAGFITGLYVIIVPVFGLVKKQKTRLGTWIGAVLATGGLYLLSVTEVFTIAKGDLLVLGSAFFWAIHVQVIGWLSPKIPAARLSFFQYVVCAVLSLIFAGFLEPVSFASIRNAALPILYGGVLSVGVAYTLQVIGQKIARPAHAAIIMSLEGVFAVLGGYLFLGEVLGLRGYLGCLLMLIGMVISQIVSLQNRKAAGN